MLRNTAFRPHIQVSCLQSSVDESKAMLVPHKTKLNCEEKITDSLIEMGFSFAADDHQNIRAHLRVLEDMAVQLEAPSISINNHKPNSYKHHE